MNIPPKTNAEGESIKRAFVATSIAIYLQACHLQHEEDTETTLLSYLMASAVPGQPGNTAGNAAGSSKAGQGNTGNSGDNDDDDADETNLGSSLVNNTGELTSEADITKGNNKENSVKEKDSSKKAANDEAVVAATSPGGTGESRIIGGANLEDDEIDWNEAVDDGTKDADAATG